MATAASTTNQGRELRRRRFRRGPTTVGIRAGIHQLYRRKPRRTLGLDCRAAALPLTLQHGEESAGSLQRRRARDHYYHHGPGAESPTRRRVRHAIAVTPILYELRVELHLCRDLLEQSPPLAADHSSRERWDSVGQSAPTVLAIPVSLLHGLDGRK